MKSDSAGIFMAAKTSEETGMRGRASEHQGKETAEARRSEEIAKPPWTLERSHSDPNAPPSLWPFLRPIMYIMSTRVSKERSYDRFPPFWPHMPTTTLWIAVLMPLKALDSCNSHGVSSSDDRIVFVSIAHNDLVDRCPHASECQVFPDLCLRFVRSSLLKMPWRSLRAFIRTALYPRFQRVIPFPCYSPFQSTQKAVKAYVEI